MRKEIEMLKVKLFFRDYTHEKILEATKSLNYANIRCKCSGCKRAGRLYNFDTEDKEAACTFGPWFDNILRERGLVILRKYEWEEEECEGLYEDEYEKISDRFTGAFEFSDNDCHLVEKPYISDDRLAVIDPDVRWSDICIGKRLWNAASINNQCIRQFERVFGKPWDRLSSPPTPPPSQRPIT